MFVSLLLAIPLGLALWVGVMGRTMGALRNLFPVCSVGGTVRAARSDSPEESDLLSPGECYGAWSRMTSYERAGLSAEKFQQIYTSLLGDDFGRRICWPVAET